MGLTNDNSLRSYFNLFSNWLLVWTIIYFLNIFPIPSPFYVIVIAIFFNIIFSLRLLYNDDKVIRFVILWILIIIAKVIPAYIMGVPKNYNGIYFGLGLFIIYCLYIIYCLGYDAILEILLSKKLEYGPGVKTVLDLFNSS